MIGRAGRYALAVYAVLVLTVLTLPMLVIGAVSFQESQIATFPPDAFSWRWYEDVVGDPIWVGSFWLSTAVGFFASLGSVAVAFAMAVVLVRTRIRFKRALYTLVLLPLIIPRLVTAVAMFQTYGNFPKVSMIIAGHVLVALPTAVIIISATIRGVDRNLERAAYVMGASWLTVLFRITLPLAAPGLAAALLLSFLVSFDEFFVALFFSAPDVVTLPIRIYTALTMQVSPSVAVVSTILIVLTALILVVVAACNQRLARRGAQVHAADGNE